MQQEYYDLLYEVMPRDMSEPHSYHVAFPHTEDHAANSDDQWWTPGTPTL